MLKLIIFALATAAVPRGVRLVIREPETPKCPVKILSSSCELAESKTPKMSQSLLSLLSQITLFTM